MCFHCGGWQVLLILTRALEITCLCTLSIHKKNPIYISRSSSPCLAGSVQSASVITDQVTRYYYDNNQVNFKRLNDPPNSVCISMDLLVYAGSLTCMCTARGFLLKRVGRDNGHCGCVNNDTCMRFLSMGIYIYSHKSLDIPCSAFTAWLRDFVEVFGALLEHGK